MREIKFRVWSVDDDCFYFADMISLCNPKASDFRISVDQSEHGYMVEQYTGLIDKNGVEIYEGDIMLIYKGKGVVVFFEGSFCCYNGYFNSTFGASANSIEVIGNIHENNELLGE